MLEKIKKWNWPVIWKVLTPALFAILWMIISSLFAGVMDLPEYDLARTAATPSNDTIYGFVMALNAGCWIATVVCICKFFSRCWSLLDSRVKRKK